MATTFTDAARTALLTLTTDDSTREALNRASYNASRNTWLVDVDPTAELHMMTLLREENAKQGDEWRRSQCPSHAARNAQ
ncbi:hypothetical protein [Streptomyces sp. NPDC001404]|uniref:hypothetical protein n=1 Tax=Streptomyces sp. NPDC001404 TaxID=3364571 RepID=UPI0036996160